MNITLNPKKININQRLGDFWKVYKFTFLSGVILGLLAYMFTFTNKLPNHDDVAYLFGKGATSASGRWGLELLSKFIPDFSMPWILGILSVIFIAASAVIVAYVFDFRQKWFQIVLGGLFVTFPSLTGTFTYMFTSASYGVAFLLATLSFLFITRNSHKIFFGILALLSAIASVSIYQAYISLTLSLLVIFLISSVMEKEVRPKRIILSGLGYVIFAVLSLGIYYAITKILMFMQHVEFGSYASTAINETTLSLIDKLFLVYQTPFKILFKNAYGFITNDLTYICYIICFITVVISLVFWVIKQGTFKKIMLLVLLFLALPVALDLLFLIVNPATIHALVLYGYVSIFALFLVCVRVLNNNFSYKIKLNKVTTGLTALGLSIILISNIYLANETSLCMHLEYENVYSKYSSLVTKIESMPEYQEGVKTAIIGEPNIPPEFYDQQFNGANSVVGARSIMKSLYTREQFMKYYLGFTGSFADNDEKQIIKTTKEFEQMPYYPYYGSIKVINGYIVVKCSEEFIYQ